jgi:hypothetical protein
MPAANAAAMSKDEKRMTADRITRARDLLARAEATRSASWASRWKREAGELLKRERLDSLSALELRARAAVSTAKTAARLEAQAAELERQNRRREAALRGAQTRRENKAKAERARSLKRERDRRYRERVRERRLLEPVRVSGPVQAGDKAVGIKAIVSDLIDGAERKPWAASGPVVLRARVIDVARGELEEEDELELARFTSREAPIVAQWIWEIVRDRVTQAAAIAPGVPTQYQREGARVTEPAKAANVAALSALLEAWDAQVSVTLSKLTPEG